MTTATVRVQVVLSLKADRLVDMAEPTRELAAVSLPEITEVVIESAGEMLAHAMLSGVVLRGTLQVADRTWNL